MTNKRETCGTWGRDGRVSVSQLTVDDRDYRGYDLRRFNDCRCKSRLDTPHNCLRTYIVDKWLKRSAEGTSNEERNTSEGSSNKVS